MAGTRTRGTSRPKPGAKGRNAAKTGAGRAVPRPTLQLDTTYMMAESIGETAGFTPVALRQALKAAEEAQETMLAGRGPGVDRLGWIGLPEQWRTPDGEVELKRLVAAARRLSRLGDRHLILGIGGSALGSRSILDAARRARTRSTPRPPQVLFAGHNLDADELGETLDYLMSGARSKRDPHPFTVSVVSKSGGTLETAAAFRMVRDAMKRLYGRSYAERVVAITDPVRGPLHALARAEGYEVLGIPPDIAGRYAALTPVGLFPAALAGMDVNEMLGGAASLARHCREAHGDGNMALRYAALMHLSAAAGRPITYLYLWNDALAGFGRWHDQLVAESLGKKGRGRVPISVVVPGGLHTRGQEVQEGPRNAVVTHLLVERSARKVRLPRLAGADDGLGYLAGREYGELLRAAYEGTALAYAVDGRPGITLRVPRLDGRALGELFYFFEWTTAVEGHLEGVNPFNQPGVEGYKSFMYSLLGRADSKGIERTLRALGQELVEEAAASREAVGSGSQR